MKYSVITFGCRVNQADSFAFEEALLTAGASSVSPEHADLIVVNTCSVTASADQGARQTIRRLARVNPSARIVVTGCYATRRPDEISGLPNVARVISNDDKPDLLQLTRGIRLRPSHEAQADHRSLGEGDQSDPDTRLTTTAARFGDGDGSCGAAIEPGVAGRTAFTLRVQTGCAEPCSYCIIPTTRGRPQSVPIAQVLREVDRIAACGFKEIAITGVHLGSYGRDLTPRASLVDLLTALTRGRESGLDADVSERRVLFRISSLEPMDCTREIVDLVARSPKLAPHFHLPLQHASNRILAAMCRPYTLEQYACLVDNIRARLPHAAIAADVIVGFPGETDEDFDVLARYLERSPLTHVHVFPYSDRPGTPAASMSDKVHGLVVRERGRRIRDISAQLTKTFKDTQVGGVHQALTLEDGSLAVTGNYQKLRIPPGLERNQWVRVRMLSAEVGEVV